MKKKKKKKKKKKQQRWFVKRKQKQRSAQIYQDVGVAMRCSIGLGSSTLLAKLAGELKKPAGLDWLTPEVLPDKITHLQLTDIAGINHGMKARLDRAGITNIQELYALAPKHARKIWGGFQGERFIRALRGEDIPIAQTQSRSVSHGQVLSRENRTPERARLVTRRLLIKAATRIRRKHMFTRSMHISIKTTNHGRINFAQSFRATQDSFYLLQIFRELWPTGRGFTPLSVNIVLGRLISPQDHIADLFEQRPQSGALSDREKLCLLIDQLNQKYGQDTLIFGERPHSLTPYTGAKIAFNRVPGREEFRD